MIKIIGVERPTNRLFAPVRTDFFFLTIAFAGRRIWRKAVLVDIDPVWMPIIANILLLSPIHVVAARLLVPYLGWIALRTALNVAIWRLCSVAPPRERPGLDGIALPSPRRLSAVTTNRCPLRL